MFNRPRKSQNTVFSCIKVEYHKVTKDMPNTSMSIKYLVNVKVY